MDFTDDFAKKYWNDFESLVMEIIKAEFSKNEDINANFYQTKATKDGGYDGIVFVESETNNKIGIKELYTLLVEAKLRKNSNKDLPLSDFAKTLIIAINKYANEVFVFTNLHFSEETQKRIKKFKYATNLNVQLVDIFGICNMIYKNQNLQSNYPEKFINQLLASQKLHNENKKTSYDTKIICEKSLPKLVGTERNALLEEHKNYLQHKNGVQIITGIQGCGKSLLLKYIINELQDNSCCITIELQKFSTIKEFFVTIISIIWNVEPIEIYDLSLEDIDEITSYMSDKYFSETMKNILINILTNNLNTYERRKDLFESQLIEYLRKIFLPILNRKRYIIAFTNFENAEENIINFTDKFIKSLYRENILFFVEIRNDIHRLIKYEKKWRDLYTEIEPIELGEFKYPEYVQYMTIQHPDVSKDVLEKLYEICFPLPLYIDNMLTFIQNGRLQSILYDENLNIKKLYENTKFQEHSINYAFEMFLQNKDLETRKLAAIISLFEGELNVDDIKKLGNEFDNSINVLAESIYFDTEANLLKIHHIIYLNPLKKRKYISSIDFKQACNLLYNKVSNFKLGKSVIEIKKLNVAILLSNLDYIKQHWKKVCSSLIKHEDYKIALSFLEQIFQLTRSVTFSRLDLITKIINCYIGLNQYDSENLEAYINLADNYIEREKNKKYKLNYLFVKAKLYMIHGNYQNVIEITNSFINEDSDLRYIRALAIKHLYGIDQCLLSLKRGKTQFPNDWHLAYSYLDHMHSKYEKINCEIAWEYLIRIESYFNKLSLEDQIHYKYNKLALTFYRNETIDIEKCRDLISQTFQNNLLVEEGRIHNLTGQLYWLNNDFQNAITELKKSLEKFEETFHATYIYVPAANLALLYDKMGNNEKVCYYAAYTLNQLIKLKKNKILLQLKQSETSTLSVVIEKEIASVWLMLYLLKKNDSSAFFEYQKQFPRTKIEEKIQLLRSTYYFHKETFMFRS